MWSRQDRPVGVHEAERQEESGRRLGYKLYYAPTMIPKLKRSRDLLLVLAIALLFAGASAHLDATWRRPLFFAHLGAFLLWQPLVAGNRRMSPRDVLLVGGAATLATLFLNPWIMLIWTALVTSLVGGRVLDSGAREQRWFYLGTLFALFAFLFSLVLPDLLPTALRHAAVTPAARRSIEIGLGLALVALLFAAWCIKPDSNTLLPAAGAYDLVHSVWLLLLLLVISFFGIALMTLAQRSYLGSIGITLVSVAALLVAADTLWGRAPSGDARGGGLRLMFSRYLLSYGIPYEVWLDRLARLGRDESDAMRFFETAVRSLGQLTVLQGARWRGAVSAGGFGQATGRHEESIVVPLHNDPGASVEVVLITGDRLSAALVWHLKLLLQITVQFYAAKAREQRLRDQQYLRAVHETGARLTHDVKNLLQSLDGLIGAAAALDDDMQVRLLAQRQLPEISRRLANTLLKLQQPGGEAPATVGARDWWKDLHAQYAAQGVEFDGVDPVRDMPIPAALFASAADNTLQNALQKRRSEPGIAIRASIHADTERLMFAVEDSGSAIEDDLATHLLAGPVASRNGLGIGLYQVARQAATLGMRFRLAENRVGCVRFTLEMPMPDVARSSETLNKSVG